MANNIHFGRINNINEKIDAFEKLIKSSTELQVKKIFTSTAFRIKDIQKIIAADPDAKFVRVYNAVSKRGGYTTFMAAVDDDDVKPRNGQRAVQSEAAPRSLERVVVKQSCCACHPCRIASNHHNRTGNEPRT